MNNEYVRAPHVGAQPSERSPHNAALLIDFDNVTMGIRSNLGQELRNLLDSDLIKEKVAVQRAYADWRRYPQHIVSLSEASIDLIFAPAYGSSRKNATDIRLAIDALELVFTRPEISTFILLSGDSDFSSLVLKLKEYGKYVIGVGLQESTSDILVQNCDEYYSYNTLGGLTSAADMSTERHDPWELVVHAIRRMVERKDVMRSDRLKQVMLEIDPSFNEKTAGFTKFNRFLTDAAHRDLIRLRKGESGQYEVAPGQGMAGGPDTSPAPMREELAPATARSESGRAAGVAVEAQHSGREARVAEVPEVALGRAYDELAAVVTELFTGSSPVRDSMAKRRLLERNAAFDEGALGFSKFSRFLKQAHDEGIVTLEQGADGNFYLTPTKAGKGSSRGGRGGGGRGGRGGGGREEPSRDAAAAEHEQGDGKGRVAAGATQTAESGEDAKAGGGSAFATAKQVARRTLGRFRGGSHAPALSAGAEADEPRPEAAAADQERSPSTPRSERPRGQAEDRSRRQTADSSRKQGVNRSRKPRGDRPRKPRGEQSQKPRGEQSQKPRGERSQKPRRERSRKPRAEGAPGSREERSRKPREDRPRAHPAEASKEGPGEASARTSPESSGSPTPEPAERASPAPGAPPAEPRPERRGMGRYRSGSVGRKGPATRSSSPAVDVGGASPRAAADGTADGPLDGTSDDRVAPEPTAVPSETPSESAADPIEHMIRNYTGVGRRTAEALVDRFGTDVFQVIDRQPERLTEVLSAARARAVIAARESERTNGGG